MKSFVLAMALAWTGLSVVASAQSSSRDTVQIREVMKSTWERPGSPLEVEPVVVSAGHAIAGWAQGDRGGRALLEKRDGRWVVYVCGGDQLKHADELARAGIPPAAARDLAAQLARSERKLPAAKLAKLGSFGEVIRVDGSHGKEGHGQAAHGHGGSTGHGRH